VPFYRIGFEMPCNPGFAKNAFFPKH